MRKRRYVVQATVDAAFKSYVIVQGESDLASAEGMNPFSAVVMLYEQPLEDIFDMSPQGRVENFGDLIGKGRIVSYLCCSVLESD